MRAALLSVVLVVMGCSAAAATPDAAVAFDPCVGCDVQVSLGECRADTVFGASNCEPASPAIDCAGCRPVCGAGRVLVCWDTPTSTTAYASPRCDAIGADAAFDPDAGIYLDAMSGATCARPRLGGDAQ